MTLIKNKNHFKIDQLILIFFRIFKNSFKFTILLENKNFLKNINIYFNLKKIELNALSQEKVIQKLHNI